MLLAEREWGITEFAKRKAAGWKGLFGGINSRGVTLGNRILQFQIFGQRVVILRIHVRSCVKGGQKRFAAGSVGPIFDVGLGVKCSDLLRQCCGQKLVS